MHYFALKYKLTKLYGAKIVPERKRTVLGCTSVNGP